MEVQIGQYQPESAGNSQFRSQGLRRHTLQRRRSWIAPNSRLSAHTFEKCSTLERINVVVLYMQMRQSPADVTVVPKK